MQQPKVIYQTVYNRNIHDLIDDSSGFLKVFIDILKEKFYSIPGEFREKAEVEVETHEEQYGVPSPHLVISYSRPETEDEINARINQEMKNKKAQEDRERKILADLKLKYEGNS
jgi:hypothetical protein